MILYRYNKLYYMIIMEPSKPPSHRRIVALDIFRGFMIFYIIILHPILQRVFGQEASEFESTINTVPIWLVIIGIPLIILAIWGTVYTFLTGTAVAYQITVKMHRAPSNEILRSQTQTRVLNSILIFGAHLVFTLFFTNKSPDYGTTSLITGYFETGNWDQWSFWTILTSGTLESIAISGIVIVLILRVLWHNGKYDPIKAMKILGVISVITVIISLIHEYYIPDPMLYAKSLLTNDVGNNILVVLYMQLFAVRFSFFPLFAYASVGAIFGIMLGMDMRFRTMAKTGLYIFLFVLSICGIYLLTGFDIISKFAQEHTPLFLHLFNIGGQSIALCGLLWFFDYSNTKLKNTKFIEFFKTIFVRYNSVTLTVFVIEPFFSILWKRFFGLFYSEPLYTNIPIMLLYLLCVALTWFIIINLWKRNEFKYSFEWWIVYYKDKILKTSGLIERKLRLAINKSKSIDPPK